MLRLFPVVAAVGLSLALTVEAASNGQPQPSAAKPAAPPQTAAAPAPVASIDQQSLLARLERGDPGLLLLDVRTAEEFDAGHLPGARNIAHDVLGARLGELADARDREVVVYCRSGRRSQMALEVLRAAGFTRLAHLDGDWLGWEAAGRPIEKLPAPTAPEAAPVAAPEDRPAPRP